MLPVIALVGRPNVGKSTLFNRLTKTRDALVADYHGLTRDRKYGEALIDQKKTIIIDTGGLSGCESGIDAEMAHQSMLAIDEADEIILIVDARAGLMPDDELIAKEIRRRGKTFTLVANKIDGLDESNISDFFSLGVSDVFPISATHGRGISQLINNLSTFLINDADSDEFSSFSSTRIAVIGRPNVGKSTLVNRMLGEERVVVYDHPGTTRDSIYINYTRVEKNDSSKNYMLIDTAGIRRRKNISDAIEKFSIIKTLQAISDSQVTILLIDATEGLVDQDLHLMSHIINAGRALVIAINKWDGLDEDYKDHVKKEIERKLSFNDFAEILFISALHGSGIGKLYKSVDLAFKSATKELSTNILTKVLEKAVLNHAPPLVSGRRIKLRYAHVGGHNPPIIIIHGNQTKSIPKHYTRYLEKTFRKELRLFGTPIRIEYRTGENPYSDKKNKLSVRQVKKRKRMIKHVSKK